MKDDQRNVYLEKMSLEQARSILANCFGSKGPIQKTEEVASAEAVGRILAKPVFARFSSPNYHAAAMDGVALSAKDTIGARETRPVILRLGEAAHPVNTGNPLPSNTDTVIMIENVDKMDDSNIRIEAPAFPWQHVRKMGEDIVATELLFTRLHKVTPYCAGALLSGGVCSVKVLQKPSILIIPTGGELVESETVTDRLEPGKVIESNSMVLGKMAESMGACFTRNPRVGDDPDKIAHAVAKGLESDFDMALIIGGSSAGSADYSKTVVSRLGRVLFHGVTIMPGKPLLAGEVKGKPVFGIPGYPVSAIVAFEQFVAPVIAAMTGQTIEPGKKIPVSFARKIPSKLGVREFFRVKIGNVNGKMVAAPLPRGAGSITSITEADGMVQIPENVEGINPEEKVEAELLKPLSAIQNTLVAVGSHDNSLDILADELRRHSSPVFLSSSHVGSMGGLMAVKKGICHLAGSHLLDTQTGEYNKSYIRRYLKGTPVKLVRLAVRDQGLMVRPGNPKNIQSLTDLGSGGVSFVNRQAGSGTRILLDFKLGSMNMDPETIRGYQTEEYTHMAVAAAVLSGAADTGLGIRAAATALHLDFLPIISEQYDLVIPESMFESRKVRTLMEVISSDRFKERVMALGGYAMEETGEVIWEYDGA